MFRIKMDDKVDSLKEDSILSVILLYILLCRVGLL